MIEASPGPGQAMMSRSSRRNCWEYSAKRGQRLSSFSKVPPAIGHTTMNPGRMPREASSPSAAAWSTGWVRRPIEAGGSASMSRKRQASVQ